MACVGAPAEAHVSAAALDGHTSRNTDDACRISSRGGRESALGFGDFQQKVTVSAVSHVYMYYFRCETMGDSRTNQLASTTAALRDCYGALSCGPVQNIVAGRLPRERALARHAESTAEPQGRRRGGRSRLARLTDLAEQVG